MTVTAAADESLTVLKAGPDGGSPRTMLSRIPEGGGGQGVRRPPRGRRRAEDAGGHGAAAAGAEGASSSRRSAASPRRRRSTRGSSAPTTARRLPRREGHLREPARPPRHGRCSTCPTATAPFPGVLDALRPQRQRQGGRAVSARRASCWRRTASRRSATTRSARASGVQLLDDQGKPAHARAARPSTRWSASARCSSAAARRATAIWDGIRSLDYLASRPEIDAEAARLHRQLRRRHADLLPDGPRRPHRRRGAVVLHHLARAALRHDRPAGRRAEHHRPGRLRHGARRLPRPCAPRSRR